MVVDTLSLEILHGNDSFLDEVTDEVSFLGGHGEVGGVTEGVLSTMNNTKTLLSGDNLECTGVTVSLEVLGEVSSDEHTRTTVVSDNFRVSSLDLGGQSVLEILTSLDDVATELRGEATKEFRSDIESTRVGSHGVTIETTGIDLRNTRTKSQDREGELTTVESLGVSLEIRRRSGLEAGVVHDRESTLGTETGLDGVNEEERAVLVGEFTSSVIELSSDNKTRVTFTHAGLDKHELTVETSLFNLVEHSTELVDVVGSDGEKGHLGTIERLQVTLVGSTSGVGSVSRTLSTAVERTLEGDKTRLTTVVRTTLGGHALSINIGDTHGEGDGLGTGVKADEGLKRTELTVTVGTTSVANFTTDRVSEGGLREGRSHNVGHHVRLRQGVKEVVRGVTKTEHTIATGLIQNGTVRGDDPRTLSSDRDIGVDGLEFKSRKNNENKHIRVYVLAKEMTTYVSLV